jgi:hypothetical protein
VDATYIRPRCLPQLQNSTASQKQHSLQNFWFFGCYLLPLAVLELHLRAKESAGPSVRFAMAAGLVVLTALMGCRNIRRRHVHVAASLEEGLK